MGRRAWGMEWRGMELGAQSSERLKAAIFAERIRSSSNKRFAWSGETAFLRCRKSTMFAFSATLRCAMLRKCLKSLLEELPLP
jgi:hypothetical protein